MNAWLPAIFGGLERPADTALKSEIPASTAGGIRCSGQKHLLGAPWGGSPALCVESVLKMGRQGWSARRRRSCPELLLEVVEIAGRSGW